MPLQASIFTYVIIYARASIAIATEIIKCTKKSNGGENGKERRT
jgi:hypothetical protein